MASLNSFRPLVSKNSDIYAYLLLETIIEEILASANQPKIRPSGLNKIGGL